MQIDRRSLTLLALLLFVNFSSVLGASKRCFNGSGDETNSLPCRPDIAGDDICCAAGDVCLSNGLCKYGPGADRNESISVDTYRPDCTDQQWNSDKCFSGCNKFVPLLVQSCSNNKYCCYGDSGCDCEKTSLFALAAATFITTLPVGSTTAVNQPQSTSATVTQGSATSTSTTPSIASSTSSTLPTSSSTSSPAKSPSNLGTAVGAGVGVGLAVVAIGSLAGFLFLRRRKAQTMAELPSGESPPTYQKRHTIARYEAYGHAVPQEIGSSEPLQELDIGKQPKVYLA